jgi:hypothetical protein
VKQSRNNICSCGSGKKFKRCCGHTVKVNAARVVMPNGLVEENGAFRFRVGGIGLMGAHDGRKNRWYNA